MKTNSKAMVLASFAADSLALGAHWIYDTSKIETELGIVDQLRPPVPNSFHSSKEKGDFTHYGDQALLLLRHLAENGGFDLHTFANAWQQFSNSYSGYRDSATRKTLEALECGASAEDCGSNSSDLGGPARIAPLIHWYKHDPELLMKFARQQTRLTHKGAGIAATTDFIVHASLKVLGGIAPQQAIETLVDDGLADIDLDMRVRSSLETVADDSREVITRFGQMCSTSAALPGAVHLICAYQDNLQEALVQNVMAGGDSAARGMIVGMILGAYQGLDGLEQNWLKEMRATEAINNYLDKA
ncbi:MULTISPECIES: ADP-ribosylglycohydrolase family protein [Desulfosediminicola]|uniref:ADP-ribosylglycohydrolase family protein n=1 Tax=Desulfosediminicola TaxID=2886823 RepID=UPI0010AD5B7A|nr:ADP-ribosylglycohydrolase family protein [Desulfosediminicola ganghwensis]